MLSFFPKPYPDEILYSMLARYHIRSGNISPKMTLKELFNSTTTIATADLPCHLETLVAQLPLISAITVEELIQQHTLYPIYAPFLPQQRSQQILQAMRSSNGVSIHDKTGIRASSIHVPRYFRFCPKCIQDDQTTYGELHWHRIHQVSGIFVCPHHAEPLQESSVPMQGMNRHEYIAASFENCAVHPTVEPFNAKNLGVLQLLAQDVHFLLENQLLPRDLNWFRQQYVSILIERGLATTTGRVYQRELVGQFLHFYGHELLKILDSDINFESEQNWLLGIVRKHRKTFHPIRHLLMLRFLGLSVSEFFTGDRSYRPFGAGPWLCLNPAADHYLKPVVTQLEISLCCDTKKPVGTFSCSCGFIYCRAGPDQTEEDTHRIGKIIAVGSTWQEKLRHLVEVEQAGLRETARQLQVDPRTVNRYVQRLELNAKWRSLNGPKEAEQTESPQSPLADSNDIQIYHRNTWRELQVQHAQASKTALRRLAPATYTWLYRNDRGWLDQNSPPAQKPAYSNNRVNWQERDKQILGYAKEAVQRLLTAEEPIRITVSRVAKAIDRLAVIEQHIDQMPETKAYLDTVTESVEDFQIRRIRWAVSQLNRQGQKLEIWRVVRLAGLRPGYSMRVQEVLDNEVFREAEEICHSSATL